MVATLLALSKERTDLMGDALVEVVARARTLEELTAGTVTGPTEETPGD